MWFSFTFGHTRNLTASLTVAGSLDTYEEMANEIYNVWSAKIYCT